MRKRLILVSVVLMFACKRDVSVYENRNSWFVNLTNGGKSGSVLTCLTWNIQLGFAASDDPWNKDHRGASSEHVAEMADAIRLIDPDIVCLQEVPFNRYNTSVKDLLAHLAKDLNMNYAFGAHGYNDPAGIVPVEGEWGNAILTRFRIDKIENVETERRSVWERRSILKAEVDPGTGNTINIYSLHFLPSEEAVPNALDFFESGKDKVQVIMGDFNMTGVPALNAKGYDDYLNGNGSFRYSIDRIYASSGKFDLVVSGMILKSDSISDHPAIFVRLKAK